MRIYNQRIKLFSKLIFKIILIELFSKAINNGNSYFNKRKKRTVSTILLSNKNIIAIYLAIPIFASIESVA
jgi:hypothetical protein